MSRALGSVGQLILEAGLVTSAKLEHSMQRSLQTGLPLGRVMVLNGILTEPMLNAALEAQIRMRDDAMITHSDALDYLCLAVAQINGTLKDADVPHLQAFRATGKQRWIRLGELMIKADKLAATDISNAVEIGLERDQLLGHVLVGQGYISDDLLVQALLQQQNIADGKLTVEEATRVLVNACLR